MVDVAVEIGPVGDCIVDSDIGSVGQRLRVADYDLVVDGDDVDQNDVDNGHSWTVRSCEP